MNLAEYLQQDPEIEWQILDDPLGGQLSVTGLPTSWRQTSMKSVTANPGPVWVDLDVRETSSQDDDESMPPFSSQAAVAGWTLHEAELSLNELIDAAAELTEDVPGWWSRSAEASHPSSVSKALYLAGSLESPYGTLVSNVHNVAIERPGELVLVQLAVTTTDAWSDIADNIRLQFTG